MKTSKGTFSAIVYAIDEDDGRHTKYEVLLSSEANVMPIFPKNSRRITQFAYHLLATRDEFLDMLFGVVRTCQNGKAIERQLRQALGVRRR